jgi:two-component system response regulator GlrR
MTPDRANRAVATARQLVAAQHSARALRVLASLDSLDVDPATRFELQVLRAQTLIDHGRFQEAELEIERAATLVVSPDQEDDLELLRAHRLARMSTARTALCGAFTVLRRHPGGDRTAKAYWIAGVALYRVGHYRWAKDCFEYSAAYYRIQKQPINLAQVLENMALVLKNEGRTAAALEHLDRAMRLYPRRGFWSLKSCCQLHRGICFVRMGQITDARTSLLQARQAPTSARQVQVHIAVHNHLGHIFRMEGNYATAREFYNEALREARSKGLLRHVSLALEFLAETCTEEGRPAEALPVLEEALAIATSLASHGDLVMEILRRRGEARVATGDRAAGLVDLRRAVDLCGARGEVREQWLAKRAYHLAANTSVGTLATRMGEVLHGLQSIGDLYEYARTVCILLEDKRLVATRPSWLGGAQATATHYFASMGLSTWSRRLQNIVGHSVHIRPEPTTSPRAAHSDVAQTSSPRFAQAIEAARLAARSTEPAVIFGETGAGKEVMARLIHELSSRNARPLVAINCGAIPANLVESELFGHVRGAFTGAERDRAGLFEIANGGTVLLDEIGDLPAEVQVKLLRFLDHYDFHRIGEHQTRKVDVRILGATHKDLAKLVANGSFRQDLFFRLNVFSVEVPALRDRREDIPFLVESFLQPERASDTALRVAPDLLRWLEAYEWPGNVRELRNLCRYLAVRCWGRSSIEPRDLPSKLQESCLEFLTGSSLSPFEREKVELERVQIQRALQQSGGSIIAAARLLGMGRNILARRIREHRIELDFYRSRRATPSQ